MKARSAQAVRPPGPAGRPSSPGILSPRFVIRNGFNLLVKRRIDFTFDRMPLRATGLTTRKIVNLFRIAFNRILPIAAAVGRPYVAHISPAGICDLGCGLCPVHDGRMRARTLLAFETFKKFVDEAGDTLLYLILWGWGEPFLNPDLPRMIAYARDRRILTVCSTNLNRLTPEYARAVVASGLDALIVALDGVTDATEGRLRPGGSATRVVDNLRRLIAERARIGSAKPFINLRMVVSRENEHEADAFRRLARELGTDMVSFKAFSTRQPGYADPAHDRAFAPKDERLRWYEYLDDYAPDPGKGRYDCRFPWTKPTLFPDGEVALCEFDLRSERPLGNILTTRFDDIWFGPVMRALRKRFRRDRAGLEFCRDCVYDYKKIPGCVVDWEYLGR